jgi:hypothetical protein
MVRTSGGGRPPTLDFFGFSPDFRVCPAVQTSLFCKTLLHGFRGDIAIWGGADGEGEHSPPVSTI